MSFVIVLFISVLFYDVYGALVVLFAYIHIYFLYDLNAVSNHVRVHSSSRFVCALFCEQSCASRWLSSFPGSIISALCLGEPCCLYCVYAV